MTHFVSTQWTEKMAFDCHIGDHIVRIDTGHANGGEDSGPGPKILLLTSLTGCTGMDIVSLLNKMRVPFSSLVIEAQTELTEEHPKVYKHIYLTYKVGADAEFMPQIEKAVHLSLERYCGVTAMLSKHCPITHAIELV